MNDPTRPQVISGEQQAKDKICDDFLRAHYAKYPTPTGIKRNLMNLIDRNEEDAREYDGAVFQMKK
jgi:hypothetical protein